MATTDDIDRFAGRVLTVLRTYYPPTNYGVWFNTQEAGAALEVSRPTLCKIREGKTPPSTRLILTILQKHSAVSAEWLMRGVGKITDKE